MIIILIDGGTSIGGRVETVFDESHYPTAMAPVLAERIVVDSPKIYPKPAPTPEPPDFFNDRMSEFGVELRNRHLANFYRSAFFPPWDVRPRSARGLYRIRR